MIWKDEIKVIETLAGKVAAFGHDIAKQVAHLESRRDTLGNEVARLDADFSVLTARNEQAKKDFAKQRRDEVNDLEEAKRRVVQREAQLITKEKELQKLKAELETQIALAKSSKETIEAIGRQHGR